MVFNPRLARILAVATAVAAALPASEAFPRVNPSVHRTLRQQGTVDLIVTLKQTTDTVVLSVKEADYTDRGAKIEALVNQLESLAASSQAELNKVIVQESGSSQPLFESTQSFWITNQVSFKGASFELVEKLSSLASIGEIREALVLPPPSLSIGSLNTTSEAGVLATNEWGVAKVQAPEVWAAGYNGQGVVIGSIDTGVMVSHTSINANWRSSFGWFDPGAKKATPYDDQSHGTHTIGTMVGSSGIGVAPGAQFIACRGCTRDGCTEEDLLACAQFMTCPTNPAGTTKDCSKAPKVINNSWGGGQGDTFYAAAINTWRAAGIIPVFAIGNQEPGGPNGCGTASSPGDDPNVISVGAIASNDALGYFSLKGPSLIGALLKPEISAPGVNVRSASIVSNTAFKAESGTSMAAPHVTGVIALLLSRNPNLNYDEVKQYITSSTDRSTLRDTGFTCGGTSDSVFPNNQYGYGRINALSAMNAVSPLPTPLPTPAPEPTPAPTPAPTTTPTPGPTPTPGQCLGLNVSGCEAVFFCSWDVMSQSCARWWN